MSHVYEKATIRIIDWLHRAERDLVGRDITMVTGKTGIVMDIRLDSHHGLAFTLDDHVPHRRWHPIAMIKQKDR